MTQTAEPPTNPARFTETMAHNYISGINLSAQTHGSLGPHTLSKPGIPFHLLAYQYNTMLYPSVGNPDPSNGSTAAFSLDDSNGQAFNVLEVANIDHNVIVENLWGGKGGKPHVANGLLYVTQWQYVGTLNVIDNYVDPTAAAYMCFLNLGDSVGMTLSVADGIATVTSVPNGLIYPGAVLGSSGWGAQYSWPAIMPYGTNGTTGKGGVGTYALSNHLSDNSPQNGKNVWLTENTPVNEFNVSGNVDMLDGSLIYPSRTPRWNDNRTGSCHRY